jgi:repressor of nif and glnA expression
VNINEFISGIQSNFGNYKPGMKKTIVENLKNIDDTVLDSLFNYVVNCWDKSSSPQYAHIANVAEIHNILIPKKKNPIIAICEFCYTGISPGIDEKGRRYSAVISEMTKIYPKKIVKLSNGKWGAQTCPDCGEKPIIGMQCKVLR